MIYSIPPEYKRSSGIYIIKNTVNAKVYVGSAKYFYKRYSTHKALLIKGKHHSKKLNNFTAKHGVDKLSFELLELVDPSCLLEREQAFIILHNACSEGFNILPCAGKGRHGAPVSEEAKAKISATLKGRKFPHMYKGMTEEAKQKVSKANKGKKATLGYSHTDEAKLQMSITRKGRKLSPEHVEKIRKYRTGLKFSEETKRKISEAATGRPVSEADRKRRSEAAKKRKQSPETKERLRIIMLERHAKKLVVSSL